MASYDSIPIPIDIVQRILSYPRRRAEKSLDPTPDSIQKNEVNTTNITNNEDSLTPPLIETNSLTKIT